MIKAIVDAYRARNGYAGLAVYLEGSLLFCEGIEPEFADRIKTLLHEARSSYGSTRATAVILGFTVSANYMDDILVISRFEGRFARIPADIPEDPEYSSGGPGACSGGMSACIITREQARKEAEHLLGQLLDHDRHQEFSNF